MTDEQKRDRAKDRRLQKFFCTSLDEYRAIEKFQAETPAYAPVLGTTRRGLDHCHTTGLIRGVLDWRVNRALGLLENAFKEDTAKVLRAMAEYVERYPALLVIGVRYGIIGKAKNKKKMVYGSVQGPIRRKRNALQKRT